MSEKKINNRIINKIPKVKRRLLANKKMMNKIMRERTVNIRKRRST